MGVNSLPQTCRQRRGCDLNPGPSAPESSTLTTRLLSHPWLGLRQCAVLKQISGSKCCLGCRPVAAKNHYCVGCIPRGKLQFRKTSAVRCNVRHWQYAIQCTRVVCVQVLSTGDVCKRDFTRRRNMGGRRSRGGVWGRVVPLPRKFVNFSSQNGVI